jgi:hypothetical protein
LQPKVSNKVRELLDEDQAAGLTGADFYADFGRRVIRVQEQLRDLLRALKSGGNQIAAYGAAAKGTILLNSSGIGADIIDFVADLSPHKQCMYMPGLSIPIVSPARLIQDMPDYVLLLAWNLKEEVFRQQAEYLRRGGNFIVPIPQPVVVGIRGARQILSGSNLPSG